MHRWLYDRIFSERVWLPPNVTWADITNGPDKTLVFPEMKDILYHFPMMIALYCVRVLLERYCFTPLGKSLGIENVKKRKAEDIPKLEAAFRSSSQLKDVSALAKQLDMTDRQVQRWWRRRRSQGRPGKLDKFCETIWTGTFCFCHFLMGCVILWDKDWLWDVNHVYIGYPYHGISNSIWWYYLLCSGFYWATLMTHNKDAHSGDYWQMLAHHIITITVLIYSWITNYHRLGIMLMTLHKSSEFILQMIKALKSANYKRTSVCLFFVFMAVWLITRMYIYPYSFLWRYYELVSKGLILTYPLQVVLYFFMCFLFMMHLRWTWMLLQVIYNAIVLQKTDDVRSSSSDMSSSENSANESLKGGKK